MSWAEQLKRSAPAPENPSLSSSKVRTTTSIDNPEGIDSTVLTSSPPLSSCLVQKPRVVVMAGEERSSGATSGGVIHAISEFDSGTTSLPAFTKGLVIIDANVIIKGIEPLLSSADVFITTSAVVNEIKDRDSRDVLSRLPYSLSLMEPTSAAVRRVIDCAQKTGDFGVLSTTDIRLCALAYDCASAAKVIRQAIPPTSAVQEIQSGQDVKVMKEEISDDECDDKEEQEEDGKGEEQGQQYALSGGNTIGSKVDDDDEEGWITPENIHQKTQELTREGESKALTAFTGGVACVTSDYAMQNVLLHLGVPLVGTNGMCIAELRLWLLRCTSCFAVVTDTTRQFCPKCGSGDTLRRVHYVINEDGEKKLFINFKRRLNTRGTIYNLPKPRGGKHGTNRLLVLREDQLAHVIRGTSSAALKAKQAMRRQMHDKSGLDEDLAAFGASVKAKKRDLAAPRMTSSYHKYNMNEKKKVRAAHRK